MSVTVHDVAKKAGVSITTVSLVLNNKPSRISKATKEKVWEAARQLNFYTGHRPRFSGSALGSIGIIMPDMCNLFFSTVSSACERTAQEKGYNTLFASTEDSVDQDIEYIQLMRHSGVDGIILIKAARATLQDEEKLKKHIVESGLPIAMVDRKLGLEKACSILVDNRAGARLAVRHLLELGHRRIGCIAGPRQDVVSFERLSGYKDALKEAGIPFDESLICPGDYRTGSGEEHLPYLLGKSVTAIFCFNDLMAMGVYKGCRSYHLKIPADLSVIGFDNIPFCEILDVPLSTVYQPAYEIGKAAIEQLVLLIEQQQAQDILFQPELSIRASTGPPKIKGIH